ncbi:16S rRNA (guanine(966)-N(2))-methyltransferase RsmD [Brevibacterium samyangense]|uniref:16S rRNA (Guanine(966)-N(2))-methyltransferase RsmD n=1 Tax=Brevibacterium samyangense TaxID=366888 RepID=A0ABP5EH51_9MICO
MRIVSGTFRGHPLRTPPGDGTRPTSDRVRESLFASLESLDMLTGTEVLDLFAGSGALGLEALSRGAARATFVEKSAAVCRVIESNVRSLGVAGRAVVRNRAALTAVQGLGDASVDLVFADPPYPLSEADVTALLEALVPKLRDQDSLVVLERSARSPRPELPAGLSVFREKVMGETTLWWLELELDRATSGSAES